VWAMGGEACRFVPFRVYPVGVALGTSGESEAVERPCR